MECLRGSDLNALADCIDGTITSQAIGQGKPILKYAKLLKDRYLMHSVTDPEHWLPNSTPFIDLTLTEGHNRKQFLRRSIEHEIQGRHNVSLAVIVNNIADGSKVLMTGRPGVGKTTLLRYIAQQWAVGQLSAAFFTCAFVSTWSHQR